VVARSGVRILGRDEVYGAYKGVSESVPCRLAAATRSLRRRRYARCPVHLCFSPQLFGGSRRRQNLGF